MKFKKQISKILVAGVLLNHLSILSYAGTLSPDTRYETFEGDSIKIDNIIEEDKVDVEIEGNTLVNILNYKDLYINNYWTYKDGVGYMKLADKTDTFKAILYPLNKEIEINKEYTLFINITKNTMQRYDDENGAIAKISLAKDVGDDNMFFIYPSQTGVIKYVFRPTEIINNKPYITMMPNSYNGEFEYKDFMIIEGNHIDKDISFFEGMKSVGQNDKNGHEIEILSSNDTLLIDNEELKVKGELYFTKGWWAIKINKDVNRVKIVVKNKDGLTRNCKLGIKNDIESEENLVYLFDMNTPFDIIERDYDLKGSNTLSFCTYGTNTMNDDFLDYYDIKVYSYDNIHDLASSVKHNKKEILLSEPLRSLPSGIKDRIIKKNGQWVIERNCEEIVLDGNDDEAWTFNSKLTTNTNTYLFTIFQKLPSKRTSELICDKLNSVDRLWSDSEDKDIEGINITGTYIYQDINVRISKNKLKNNDSESFKEWLKSNPLTLVYELNEPYYEPLNVDSVLNLYEETTYISNNSNIPANMRVVVDRLLNMAIDSSNEAITLETIESISTARTWVNMLPESIIKDELQSKLNNIFNISELNKIEIEKKNTTANTDVYIQPINTLVMSLSTNSITFDEFSGAENLELKNALNIFISSSLPYNLNASLPTEIYNSNKTDSLPKNIINIKEDSNRDYKAFSNLNDKIILKENNPSGNNIKHSVDLMLSGGITHKKDVYKAIIKFEVEQK